MQKEQFLKVLTIFSDLTALYKILKIIEFPHIFHWKSAKRMQIGLI